MESQDVERRESTKRRRLSERRRIFSRLEPITQKVANSGSVEKYERHSLSSSRSDSPQMIQSDQSKISMKIQFHIAVAPDDEPLILDEPSAGLSAGQPRSRLSSRRSTDSWIGEQINERLVRQNTLSIKRRQQLLSMHNQALPAAQTEQDLANRKRLNTRRASSHQSVDTTESLAILEPCNERSSTITDGMTDEATARFLARNDRRPQAVHAGAFVEQSVSSPNRELIFFKRDGQRFGHECTLKLAVDRTYRCLVKVRPLIPLQSISIQGHQVLFVDCSPGGAGSQRRSSAGVGGAGTSSAPASSSTLNRSWQDIHTGRQASSNKSSSAATRHHRTSLHPAPAVNQRISHALTSPSLGPKQELMLHELQQSQMMRHFAASHCSSLSSSPHLGAQLIYMFDWSASRFEVTKNKARTEVQAVLKFTNGQILTLPLQVKFYRSERRQHLNWGTQLHFIDYDCAINKLGQMGVERVQYY